MSIGNLWKNYFKKYESDNFNQIKYNLEFRFILRLCLIVIKKP